MNIKEKEKSLLEIAVTLIQRRRKPQKMEDIIKDVMTIKGYTAEEAEEHTPQFLLDFMKSGYFIYCGKGLWDLKERQPVKLLDKDGDYEEVYFGSAKDSELTDNNVDAPQYKNESDMDDPEDDDYSDDDADDLSKEFGGEEDDNPEDLREVEIDIESEIDEEDEEERDERDSEFDYE